MDLHVAAGTTDLLVEVQPAADIAGTIRVTDRGAPGVLVRIQVMPLSYDGDRLHGRSFVVFSRRDGAFRVPRLAPGAYDLEFEAPDADDVGLRVLGRVAPGTTDLDVVLPAGASLRGRLEDENGDGVSEHGYLHVVPQGIEAGAPGSVLADVDHDGRFSFDGVARGKVEIYLPRGDEGYVLGPFEAPAEDVEVVVSH